MFIYESSKEVAQRVAIGEFDSMDTLDCYLEYLKGELDNGDTNVVDKYNKAKQLANELITKGVDISLVVGDTENGFLELDKNSVLDRINDRI